MISKVPASDAQRKYILGLARKSKLHYNALGDEELIAKLEEDWKIKWAELGKIQATQIIQRMIHVVDWQRHGQYLGRR